MATVELRFSALPSHVRTARLVAAAVARQAGVDDSVLDEVRLAVGEACSRAVGLHVRNGVSHPVRVKLTQQEKRFLIEVGDGVPTPVTAHADSSAAEALSLAAGAGGNGGGEQADDTMGLAVISGLVDDLVIGHDDDGGIIRMSWPIADPADDEL
ncbi:ATP-binding protein [Streptacidiphilus jiangxiensis]|uniref:Anti-sigma regulatory factor (Ser/Thr protein kinase) n=1 Tax=Streptacidiphilus jiangxiensis TaxID=235985 RepID=A0A1H7PUW3_STRJI|nr:ATP-binding protein [Streptacidiphilus jiangxiensis]SEL39681.1 Anti-sigma regulatory factor (Ser/Thr protein kinase) [Streptacidiphilus jiangxiensis]